MCASPSQGHKNTHNEKILQIKHLSESILLYTQSMYRGQRVGAIVLMAGSGHRFGDPLPKQFASLAGIPLYQHAYQTLLESPWIDELLLVTHPDYLDWVPYFHKIAGGPTRQASSLIGISHLKKRVDLLLIHDAVRPFITERIIEENLEVALSVGAADTCIPSADTLVYAPNGTRLTDIPPRAHYLRGQTPQTFQTQIIVAAHEKALRTEATDDCQLVLAMGQSVGIVRGEEWNIKVTSPQDLAFAELIYSKQMGSHTINSIWPGPSKGAESRI